MARIVCVGVSPGCYGLIVDPLHGQEFLLGEVFQKRDRVAEGRSLEAESAGTGDVGAVWVGARGGRYSIRCAAGGRRGKGRRGIWSGSWRPGGGVRTVRRR